MVPRGELQVQIPTELDANFSQLLYASDHAKINLYRGLPKRNTRHWCMVSQVLQRKYDNII
mgnify:CR=1